MIISMIDMSVIFPKLQYEETVYMKRQNLLSMKNKNKNQRKSKCRLLKFLPSMPSRKHAYIILTPLNPTFI